MFWLMQNVVRAVDTEYLNISNLNEWTRAIFNRARQL